MRSIAKTMASLQALAAMGLPAGVLVPALLEALHGVVPSSRNLFDWADPDGRLLRYFIEGPIDAAVARLYFDEFHNRREAEAMPRFDSLALAPQGVRGPQDLAHERFYGSDLYRAIWRPQGLHARLEAVLRGRGGLLLGSLVLYRGPQDAPFSAAEAARLAGCVPLLATAIERAARMPPAAERQVASPEPAETLLLALDGRINHASAGAHRLLLMADGGASREALSRPLPQLAGGLLALLLARLRERGAAPAIGPPLTVTLATPAGIVTAQGTVLAPQQPGSEPLVQVSLRRLEPQRVALERALRGLPLTPGQMAVCRELLLRGGTQAEIGTRLGVATATVIDHLRKVYDTLDLASAAELRAFVDARVDARAFSP